MAEGIPDNSAALAFTGVEYADFLTYCRGVIGAALACSIVEKLLDAVGGKRPEEAAVFRAYYLEGEKKPTARQIARRLCMDVRTVHRYNRRILIEMLPVAFGVYGLFYPDSNQKQAAGGPEKCQKYSIEARTGEL